MDSFLLYLIIMNVVTFLAFTVDFFLCMVNPDLDNSAANSLILDVFPIAGGAVGMLLALFVWGGLGRGHRMNKDNIAWWFLAIVCLVVWGLVVAAKFGLITLDTSIGGILSGWDLGKLRVMGIYLAVLNVITLAAFAWDKHVAESGNDYGRRAPEARLLGLCLVGGSVGGMIAMNVVRHKTKKWHFVWGLPLFIILDIAVVLYAHMGGLI